MSDTQVLENTGFLSDCDIKKAISDNNIVIWPFSEKNLTPLGYNLSFTKFLFSTRRNLLYKIQKDKTTKELYCMIEPNDTILILTKEAVWVSEQYAGTFHSKVGIVSKGFGHISTTLDPNWEGPLLISLNNPTNKKIKLVIGEDDVEVKYKTFATLIFYKMISSAEGRQDNLPSRIEILKNTQDKLSNSKKYKQLISIINQIRNFESLQVNIGNAQYSDRSEKIREFKEKYNRFAVTLNSNIDMASSISSDIKKGNDILFIISIVFAVVIFGLIIYMGWKAYSNQDTNMISFISIIASAYVVSTIELLKYVKHKLF